jgi:hypothetical protein
MLRLDWLQRRNPFNYFPILSRGNAGMANGLNASDNNSISLSSPAILFSLTAPHLMHLCTMDHSPFGLAHTAIGSMTDLHAERRSPIWKSTWQLHKHLGQWFLCSVPVTVFSTSSLHLAQLNCSPIDLPCGFWDNCWFLRMKKEQTSQRNQSAAVLLEF